MRKKSDKKLIRFLIISLMGISLLVTCLFTLLAVFINWKSAEAVEKIGDIYMKGMNGQIRLHYQTTIDLRISQVKAMINTILSEQAGRNSILSRLEVNAKARGFEYLAFCSPYGRIEKIYGKEIKINDMASFIQDISQNKQKITTGTDNDGNTIILLGISCAFDMQNGKKSAAILAGISVNDISDILFLDTKSSLVYSYVIRKDGSYVIRSDGAFKKNYFERLYSIFEEQPQKSAGQYISDMISAMEDGKEYAAILDGNNVRSHISSARLPYSDWYLVIVLPLDTVTKVVSDMKRQWMYMVYGVCAAVLCVLLLIFAKYFKITKKQINNLERITKEAEKAYKEAERANRAKSEFLSNMSHDIRTPMNAIVGMTAIAMANLDDRKQTQICLEKITLSSKHLLGLINDVLDMSKIESGKMTLNMELVSLRETIDSVVSIVQPQIKAKRQRFDIFIHDITAENIRCDGVRLNQILINLLGNAIKFTPEEGSVFVTLYEEPSPRGEPYIRINLIIKDTGIGMSEEYQKIIFEPFSREYNSRAAKTEGTGLGMAITKYIIDAMEGTISVKSKQGCGSEFRVVLDMVKEEMKETDMILPDLNMLVADDDEQLCESVIMSLKSIGINADWSLSAEAAVKKAEDRHLEHNDYNIILLDWKLPEMDGIAAAKEIRRRCGNDTPILLISAYDWSGIENDARNAGVNGFISKPLFKSTLFYGLKPFVAGTDAHAEEKAETENAGLKGKRILLAEDNELNWEVAKNLLSNFGIELELAENGLICLDKFSRSPAGYYDAILMDIQMPVMDGCHASQAIRELERPDRNVPIIAMTANAFSEDIQKCLKYGMNAHIAKPINIQEVLKLLKKYIK